ncbi:PREDICTED: mediator of RNA polymerase II transcription subunit 13 [Papilio xuthus]|uniref:Mediator of RNA polymerase II transcription subunit 13 n=1 Tax=Papilio xuthus TaxID=66420 RepID=A0AAJ6ZWI8_PAPXU|nr:PREDICTED: mediator of RNA polymerase II transcription subunit 13 [Papilio xuthus]
MTHQNHQTNGASLEDCHTNFFALTELYGIKWRKLVWQRECGGGGGKGEEGAAPLGDPVISSYARCLAGDILCVWRRVPSQQSPDLYDMPVPPPLSLRAAKELWIFWYGEEPDLSGLVAPELIASQGDHGSWESGLSYECRSLLFKALHNLIERCLLSRDFVRLGKWFVQPYDGDEEDVGKSPWHLSFSFAFFLHGESTVCASVDVRQHPPVRTLTAKRLARLARLAADDAPRDARPDTAQHANVILAPFGLEGRVTGREWSDGDAATARLLDAWRQLYPLEHGCGAVEVECGGVRMRYPLPYALLTEMEAPAPAPPPAAAALAGRTLRALTTPHPHQTAELCYGEAVGDKSEDFADPTRKTPCSCAKSGGVVGACSPGSCGGASPAPAVSAPSSAGAPPPSPHLTALPAHQTGGAVPTTLHTPAPTPDPHAPPTPAPPSAPPHKPYTQGDSPGFAGCGSGGGGGGGGVSGSGAIPGGGAAGAAPELVRRPALPPAEQRLDPLEDEHSLHMLYDYTTVHAWLEHPVKRFKTETREWSEELALGARGGDLYAGHAHTPPPAPHPARSMRPQRPHHAHLAPLAADVKQERLDEDSKEYKNLFTSDGLCPTLKDLDQIFDNSDDAASGDETAAADAKPAHDHLRLNLLEYSDGGAAAASALREAAVGGPAAGAGAGAVSGGGAHCAVHRWPFIGARAPRSSRDVVRLMRRLRPLLQDAIQKRCCGARMWDGVTGPLTWRQFHRLAGRGNEDLCEPQPVPPLLVGHDRDWISLSPYALRHWERLSLEPYSYARDVAYVALAPDGEALTDPLRAFFRELSTAYEACRLGRHQPIARIARDGIVRTVAGERCDTDEWAGELPPGRLGEYIRAYADTLRELTSQLSSMNIERVLFEGEKGNNMRPPAAPEQPGTPGEPGEAGEVPPGGSASAPVWEEDEAGPPALVLYLVEPPAAHAHRALALHALLRLAAQAHHHLQHHNPYIKIISLEGVYECWAGRGAWGAGRGGGAELRTLAFSVFCGARRLLQHQPNGKSLTGFGTAANANLFLNNKDEKNRAAYRLFTPAWVLAPPRALREVAETWGTACGEQCSVLFVAYCLSHDQRWLLAAATDARGELLDTAAINIHVPARSRRRRSAPARRLGLTKLMDFTLGVMSQAAQPWRLVVGRVGRIGHGELKGWSYLLSRKNLVRASSVLREICGSCATLYPGGAPCVLSACLVSTEPDPCLRLMADRFTPDERFSQASIQSHLHTPRDVTATHILVFPTSAKTQSNQMPFEQPMANGEDNDIFMGVDMGDEDIGEDNMADLIINDMFTNMWAQSSPRASPRRHDDDAAGSREGSPARRAALGPGSYRQADDHQPEQVGTILQQPLALGYLVSTAPLGAMPAWWWAGCAHLRDSCPAFLKNALHLHSGSAQTSDDFTSLMQRRDNNSHPLDSQTTTDVLRYVLEGYNALSWLTLDGSTHDRLSCLPLHVQALMQLYHTAAALG